MKRALYRPFFVLPIYYLSTFLAMEKLIQLQQAGLEKLSSILGSNALTYHFKKWISILLELILYLLFVFGIVMVIYLQVELSQEFSGQNLKTQASMRFLQVFLVIFSLPAPLLAILLGRNRKKNELIKQAFEEVKRMKKVFDETLKGFKF